MRNVIVVEELDPFIEEQVRAMGIPARGKDIFSICGVLLPEDIAESCRKAGILKDTAPAFSDTSESLPSRSPLLCSGCPHRSTFYNLSQMKVPVAGDIGCYNLGTLPPFNAQHTMGAMARAWACCTAWAFPGCPSPPCAPSATARSSMRASRRC